MTDVQNIANHYIATWNEIDAFRRQQLIEKGWSSDARYQDPLASTKGHVELDALIGSVHTRFPGFRFALLGKADGHGDFIRFSWGLGPAGAEPIVEGSDVVVLENGRMKSVIGFLDKVPAAA
jgi:hypothetical protein